MAPVLSERFASISIPGSESAAPFSTTTLITSIAIIISSILGVAIVAAIAIVIISIRRRIRDNLAATIARDFVPTVVVTDMTTYPHSTSVISMDNDGSLNYKADPEKAKHASSSARGSVILSIIHEENEDIDLDEEKAEFLVAHPHEIEDFDQSVGHQFQTTEIISSEKIPNPKRNGQLFVSDSHDAEKADVEAPMSHRDSIQLYSGLNSDGSIFRTLQQTLDEHQDLTSETSRYSWESTQSARHSDSDVPVYPGEEDIASSAFEPAPSTQKPTAAPALLESKTFTSSAASLFKQFWQFSSQDSIRKKAATTHDPLSPSGLIRVSVSSYSVEVDTITPAPYNADEADEGNFLDPAILKYCWHLDAQSDEAPPRESTDTDGSATLGDCVVSNSYTTSQSLDSICFIQRRSTEETSDDAHFYDVPMSKDTSLDLPAPSPATLTSSNIRNSGISTNSRRARIDARKSKPASILDSLYLGRQNWNKKQHAKRSDKEKAMEEFSKIQRVAFNDSTNVFGAH